MLGELDADLGVTGKSDRAHLPYFVLCLELLPGPSSRGSGGWVQKPERLSAQGPGSPQLPAFSPIICFQRPFWAFLQHLFPLDLLNRNVQGLGIELSGRGPHLVPWLLAPPSAERWVLHLSASLLAFSVRSWEASHLTFFPLKGMGRQHKWLAPRSSSSKNHFQEEILLLF